MPRKTVKDMMQTHLPQSLGLCNSDLGGLCQYLNEAQWRLVPLGSENGWWGAWDRLVFDVDRADPYIVLGREYARITDAAVCRIAVPIHNEFYELLLNGVGLTNPSSIPYCGGTLGFYDRGTVPTQRVLTATGQLLRFYPTHADDVTNAKRILIKGKDQNGLPIWSDDAGLRVEGFYLTLASPFVTSSFIVTEITGIVKDATAGDVLLFQVDSGTGAQVLLSRYGPDETVPDYRKYYLYNLPTSCCDGLTTIQVTVMAKREPLPLSRETDFMVIQSIPALIEECTSIRLGRVDDPQAKNSSLMHHQQAIKRLREELDHYEGKQTLSVVVRPHGTATLENHGIGNTL